MAKTLIAGGTGFIGQRLAEMMQAEGHEVTALGTNARPCPRLEQKGIAIYFADLAMTPLAEIVPDTAFDYVINLSGYGDYSPLDDGGWQVFQNHTQAMMTLIDGLDHHRLQTFIQAGSCYEYGNAPAPQIESYREDSVTPYALAKLTNTHLIQMLAHARNFPGIIVRPFFVYGPMQTGKLIPFVIKQCLEGNAFDTTKGEQLVDYIFIDDLCQAIMSLLDKPNLAGEIFNVGSGEGTSIRSVIERIIKIIGQGQANFGARDYRNGESMALYADISAIKKATGWQAITTLEDGLNLTIEAMKAETRDG